MTDEDIIGYLAGGLDTGERAVVEARLASDPAAARRLAGWRELLAPLEADRDQTPPPAGLADRTLERLAAVIAAHQPPAAPPRPLPRAPREEPETRAVGGRFRPDLIVACGIALFAGGLVFSAVGKARARHEMLACQNALRVTHGGLSGYADANGGRYPQVKPDATAESFAAVVAPHVPANFRLACPSCPPPAPAAARTAPAAGFTYTLGYRTPPPARELVGLCRPADGAGEHDLVPISADYPAAGVAPAGGPVCPHRAGMNVLYAGGQVRLVTSPLVGPNEDHIFQNVFGAPRAGEGRTDIVLGRPGDRP